MDATGVASTVSDGWLVWECPGKPVSVRLSPDVAGRLGMAVREGFKALPRRGLETGGLLIGTRSDAGNPVVVEIDDFEPVESEHAAGPAYLLSAADRRRLEASIVARKAAGKNTSIVGFYRSHTRPDFAITGEDATLFSTYFKEASDVFLLIKPNEGGPPTGGFIIREGGKVLSDTPYVQFPVEGTISLRPARETTMRAIEESGAPVPAVRAVLPPASLPTRLAWKVRWPSWPVAAGIMALAVGLFFGIHRLASDSTSARPGRSLALNVTSIGNSLRLSWDHQLPSHAGHAVLWIKDGQEQERLELDAKQLREGSVVYWPRHSDVDFRLELLSPGGNVTESVRSIGGPTKPAVVNPAPQLAAVAAPTVPAPKRLRGKWIAPRASVSAPKTPVRNRIVTASLPPSRTFALPKPASNSTGGASASVPDPPTIQPAPAEHARDVFKTIGTDNRPDRADSSFHVSVEPVVASRRSIPLIGKLIRRADFVPPAPLRNPGLTIPPHRNLARDVKINVKVYVNPSGKVDYSEVLSKVPETDRDLAVLAMFSARRWEFVPARDGDSTVPGEVILHYQFGPGAR